MPTTISIPNAGDIEFPDSMSDAQIEEAARKLSGVGSSSLGPLSPPQVPFRPPSTEDIDKTRGAFDKFADVYNLPGQGVEQAVEGAKTLASWPEEGKRAATSDVIEGTGKALLPLIAPLAVAKPMAVATGFAVGIPAMYGTEYVAQKLGAEPETARLAGNIAALIPIGIGGARGLGRGRRLESMVAKQAEAAPKAAAGNIGARAQLATLTKEIGALEGSKVVPTAAGAVEAATVETPVKRGYTPKPRTPVTVPVKTGAQIPVEKGATIPVKKGATPPPVKQGYDVPALTSPEVAPTPIPEARVLPTTPSLATGNRYRITSADPIYDLPIGQEATYKGKTGGFHRFDVGGKERMLTDAEMGQVGLEGVGAARSAAERGSFSAQPLPPPRERIALPNPEVDARIQAARNPVRPDLGEKITAWGTKFWERFTRPYEELPRGERYGPLIFRLKQLEKSPSLSQHRAITTLGQVTKDMDAVQYDAFSNKVLFDDLVESIAKFKEQGKEWKEFPFGLRSADEVVQHRDFITAKTTDDPVIQTAIDARKQAWEGLRRDFLTASKDAGFDVADRFNRDDYFHHIVFDYAQMKRSLREKELQTSTYRGYLKKRTPNKADYLTDYLESEYEVMSQLLHDTQKAKTISWIRQNVDISDRLREAARVENRSQPKGMPRSDWRDSIPEGYKLWQPRPGSSWYVADTLQEKLAREIVDDQLGVLVKADDLKKALAKGSPFREMVLPEEVVNTITDLTPRHNPAERILAGAQTKWKEVNLISPFRYAKYNIRNLSGDAEATFVGNPSGFTKSRRAVNDFYHYYRNGKMTPELQEWFDRGGLQTLLQAQEMGELSKIKELARLYPKKKGAPDPWGWYWRKARVTTDFRESILRYANYLDFKEQLARGNGRPKSYGASIPDEVNALTDPRDKAFKLSNDLLGAYDEVSVNGQMLRRDLIPFWSFQELNFRRYVQMIRNAAREGDVAGAVGRKLLGKAVSPYTAYRVGSFAIKASAAWAALYAINQAAFPDAWDDLPDNVKARPVLILGRESNGEVRYFSRLGSMSDIVEWFGDEETIPMVKRWLNGERSLGEIVKEIAWTENPVINKLYQSASPLYKAPIELPIGQTMYPKVSEPRTIHDRIEYAFDIFGLGDAYNLVSGKPTKPLSLNPLDWKAITYQVTPGQNQYYRNQDSITRFKKEAGLSIFTGGVDSDRSTALFYLKMAVRDKDEKAEVKYTQQFLNTLREGEDPVEILQASFDRLHPLAKLQSKAHKRAFIQWLDEDGLDDLEAAIKFYETVLMGDRPQQ